MIRISQIRLSCGHDAKALEGKIRKLLRMGNRTVSFDIVRHSVDARKKPQLWDIYTVDVRTGMRPKEEAGLVRRLKNKNIALSPDESYQFPACGREVSAHRPVVIGAGPAGLFCALFLAEHGYRPILIERGKRMEERAKDVARFWETGALDPGSNVQFGEGGAGTFSDGKLNTQVNDRTGRSREVLRLFAQAGAPASILYEAKPHIGTDRLRTVIPGLRKRIEEAGGEVFFETCCTGLCFEENFEENSKGNFEEYFEENFKENSKEHCGDTPGASSEETSCSRHLKGIYIRSEKESFLPADIVVLAIGHSARDTIEAFYREGVPMEQKQFAVGLRVVHPQSLIDESQYGLSDPEKLAALRLSAAPYKLTARAASGRGVYSFCMCPGGYIVNASSEPGRLCVNGMSDKRRDSGWANSAIVVTVGEREYGSGHVLAGMHFQRTLEEKAFALGQGSIPVQRYIDFKEKAIEKITGKTTEKTEGGMPAPGAETSLKHLSEMRHTQVKAEETPEAETSLDHSSETSCETLHQPWAKGACRCAGLHTLLPSDLTQDFVEGMEQFGKKVPGFDGPDAFVAGMESRTSSPVRIPRRETMESTGVSGLYPCGEGAGYAGGIMSAAMDGMRIAEAIARKYAPPAQASLFPDTNSRGSMV